jgi:hypothetical protein
MTECFFITYEGCEPDSETYRTEPLSEADADTKAAQLCAAGMKDVTILPAPYPQTPAEVAAAVLDAIEARPDTLYMKTWATLPAGVLHPSDKIECGTTMCIAGWAAHLTGYTLRREAEDVGIYAEKDSGKYEVENVAAEALGLGPDETSMFWLPAPEALQQLRAIAGR